MLKSDIHYFPSDWTVQSNEKEHNKVKYDHDG